MWTMNFLMFKLVLEKAEEPEIKLPTSAGSWKKQENSRKKNLLILYWLCKTFDCVAHTTVENASRDGIPYHLTCLLRNSHSGQEGTVRTGHGTMDSFKIGKGVRQVYILSTCLFNLQVECIMWNCRLDEAQAGIKIAGRNINNLRYADDTILMAESKEEPKSL